MNRRRWAIVAACVVALGLVGGIAAWQLRPEPVVNEPAPANPIPLQVENLPRELTIGIVLSVSSPSGQGKQWRSAAEGAQVAAYRMDMAGNPVTLSTADDKGNPEGARKAVQKLIDQGASAIVLASSGSHVEGAVAAAEQAGVPLLLPHSTNEEASGKGVWNTGPTESDVTTALQELMAERELEKPLLIDGGGGPIEGIQATDTIDVDAGTDPADFSKALKKRATKKVDSILVSGPAEVQALVVRAAQGMNIELPIVLTPDALSPDFPRALTKAGGSLTTPLSTVGLDTGDAVSLRSGPEGAAMSSFLGGLRLMAQNPTTKGLLGEEQFVDVGYAADARSHDAVLAAATAAAAAKSTAPDKVGAALRGLELTHADGIVGPDLDLRTAASLVDGSVIALSSSDQSLGLRPEAAENPQLSWFATPSE